MTVDKVRESLIAAFALAGRVVHATAGGGFVVTAPHGQRRHCRDFESLQTFAREVGIA